MEDNSAIYCRSAAGVLERFSHRQTAEKSLFQRVLIRNTPETCEPVERRPTLPAGSPVPSLYDQCMKLLARHTHAFESLEDFPLDFGREIFEQAESHLMVDSETTKQSLEMFASAYPKDFLPSCCLSSCLSLINDRELSLSALLSQTVQLEITDCHIDDDHDILGEILKLEQLEDLSLARNNISDKGLKRLLLPVIGKKALRRLTYLDISFNKLDIRSLRRLKFLSLDSVILGESDFPSQDLCDAALGARFVRRPCPRVKQIQTSGFGSSLLAQWKENLRKARVSDSDLTGWRFYSRPRLEPGETEVRRTRSLNKIMYTRTSNPLSAIQTNTQYRPQQVTKRKLESDISDEIFGHLNDVTGKQTNVFPSQNSKKFKPNCDSQSDSVSSTLEENILKLYS